MGLMGKFFGGGKGGDGNNLISHAKSGYGDAFNADNLPNGGVFRSTAISKTARRMTAYEAGWAEAEAKKAEAGAEYHGRVVSALKRVETADTKIHVNQRDYETHVALKHDEKLEANNKQSIALNPLRQKQREREMILQQHVQHVNGVLQGVQNWEKEVAGYFN